jgi:hypothetical protein
MARFARSARYLNSQHFARAEREAIMKRPQYCARWIEDNPRSVNTSLEVTTLQLNFDSGFLIAHFSFLIWI